MISVDWPCADIPQIVAATIADSLTCQSDINTVTMTVQVMSLNQKSFVDFGLTMTVQVSRAKRE